MDALLEAGIVDDDTMDLKSFRMDLKDMSEQFYGRSLQNISVRDVYDQVIQLVLKYRIRLPRNLLLLFKTLIQTEALGKILGSDASLLEVTKPYATKLLKRGYDATKLYKNIRGDVLAMGNQMRTIPKFVHEILRQTAQGKQQLELRHSGLRQIITPLLKGINRLTIGMVISASLIAGALILNSTQKVFEFSFNLLGLEKISVASVLGLTGYVIATLLGIWLVIVIFRSNKL
jgi:ubiquinone biosynthesis protein